MCLCNVDKIRAFCGFTTRKSSAIVIFCSLVEFNDQKGAYYARRFILRKKFGAILLTRQKKGPGKLYYGKPRLVYRYAYVMITNAERQHTTAAVQTYNIRYRYRCSLY